MIIHKYLKMHFEDTNAVMVLFLMTHPVLLLQYEFHRNSIYV